MCALSPGVPTRVALCRMPRTRRRSRNAWAAYSLPRSLWKMRPERGRRRRPAERPGEHPAGALVQDDRQKAPPPDDGHVRNVPDPDLIGAPGDPSPQPIRMLAVEAMEPGIGPVELGHAGAQAGRPHQPRDAAPTDRPPLGA